ncbi:hypothetical protein [Anaerovibrio sp.]|nr:hypothetical protein [Anaerovibrio sp.]
MEDFSSKEEKFEQWRYKMFIHRNIVDKHFFMWINILLMGIK